MCAVYLFQLFNPINWSSASPPWRS